MPPINKPTPVNVDTPAVTPIGPLDRAPVPVDVGTPAVTPIGPLDRAPVPVEAGTGLGAAVTTDTSGTQTVTNNGTVTQTATVPF